MAELDTEHNKLIVKLVYYGPALSGKTTNLMRLHDILERRHCGELMAFETKGDRTLFFDLLPLVVRSDNGFTIKIKLFTVPGQVAHDATRKAVLSRADGVVFVADSQTSQALSNFQSFENLEQNARRVGINFEKMPLVVQFNKRDLDDIVSEQDLLSRWQPSGLPIVLSSALHGHGVFQTFQRLLVETYRSLDDCYELRDKYRLDVTHFTNILQN